MYGGVGQIKLRLANGDVVIYGHMHTSNFQAGQTIKAGQAVGTTGGMNGDHLHLEYQTPDSSTGSGWRAVDPRGPFSGDFSGSYSGGGVSGTYMKTGPGYTLPLTYHNILMGVMLGKNLPYGDNGTFGSAADNPFRAHLLSIMNGTYNQNNTLSRAQALGYVGRNSVIGAGNNALPGGGPFTTTNVSNKALSKDGSQIVSVAQTYLGTPYVWGGHTPSGWDCSGFVGWFYQNYLGIDIGYGSHYQYNTGRAVDKSQLQIGDLVFFDTAGGQEVDAGNTASHVGMYIGNGQIIHAANPSTGTIISSLSDPYYSGTYLGARRYA
jgi:cell wall-associated NlpC family hydrolase